MRAVRLSVVTAAATAAALAAVTGCTQKSDAKNGDAIQVTATDTACKVSKAEFPAGHVQLDIENKGSKVTEVYLLFPDDRIVSERENIGPGTKQRVTAEVKAGEYTIACKPGMKGKGIRQAVKVTGGKVAKRDPRLDKAVAAYREYAQEQADATLPKAEAFSKAVNAGYI
jgi:iron uptake system component EfeO